MDEREILRIAVQHDVDQYLTEALTLEFVRDVLKAAFRPYPETLTEWRKQFEAAFPIPPDCIWTGKGYAQTHHNAWRAQAYAHMWDGFVAARRTTPDREAIIAAARDVVRDALDDVSVHPCDVHNDDVKAARLSEPMRALYSALKAAPTNDQGEKS